MRNERNFAPRRSSAVAEASIIEQHRIPNKDSKLTHNKSQLLSADLRIRFVSSSVPFRMNHFRLIFIIFQCFSCRYNLYYLYGRVGILGTGIQSLESGVHIPDYFLDEVPLGDTATRHARNCSGFLNSGCNFRFRFR